MDSATPKFEAVDAEGRKTGQLVTVAEAKAQGLRLQYTEVFVFNKQGEILVAQRVPTARTRPNLLGPSAAGMVDVGESHEDCARRELKEELGVDLEIEYLFTIIRPWGLCAVYKAVSDGPFTLQEAEVQLAEFKPVEQVRFLVEHFPYLVINGFVETFNHYLSMERKDD